MIYLIGLGINGHSHLTLDGLEKLKSVDLILTFSNEKAFYQMYGFSNVRFISYLYQDGAEDAENYSRIFDYILKEHQAVKSLAVLVPGHPRVGVTFANLLERECENNSIELRVIEGISSLDTMFNDLKRDPLEIGSTVLDVNRFLLFNLSIDPVVDHYFYHICSVGTRNTNVSNPSKDNQIILLRERLTKYYPDQHKVYLLRSAISREENSTKIEGSIGKMEVLLPYVDFSTTLFIPGVRPRTVNKGFLNLIRCKVKNDIRNIQTIQN